MVPSRPEDYQLLGVLIDRGLKELVYSKLELFLHCASPPRLLQELGVVRQ